MLAAGAPFPVGTVQWAVPPLGSYGIVKTVQSLRIDENTPDLYIEDDGAYGGNGSIRALTADGQQKWIWPSTSQDWFPLLVAADDQGGAVYFSGQDTPGPYFSYCYFGRVDQTGTETWQYQESNCREDYAIPPDGTIFLVEDAYQNNNIAVVTALDPITGQVKFNITLPASSQYTSGGGATQGLDPDRPSGLVYCTPGTLGGTVTQTMAIHGSISASSDGNVYIPFTTSTAYGDASGCDPSPDPSYPKYPHLVQPGDGNWSASATLQLMTIHPDGSYSTQQLDANSTNGTGMTIGSAAGFFTLGRAIPDGQGGTLLTVWSPPMLYHASSSGVSKFALPIFPDEPPGDDLFAADSMLLGEGGTAYIVGSSSEEAPIDTVLAIDSNTGSTKWTASPGLHPKLSTVTSDGSVAFQYSLPDFSVHSALASPSGQVSPLFANPNDNSDAGPVLPSDFFGLHLPSYWTLGTWHASLTGLSIAAVTGPVADPSSNGYAYSGGDPEGQKKAKIPIIHTFIPDPYLKDPQTNQVDPLSPKKLSDFLRTQFAGKAEVLGFPLASATYPQFQKDIQKPLEAFGFIGHSFELGAPATSVGLCFYINDASNPQYTHDCIIQHDYIANFDQASIPFIKPEDVTKLYTQPKVIFIAACATQDAFRKLWDIDSSTKGRALIIPQTNLTNNVDLLWGATAWAAILNSLLQGKSVGDAVTDGNAAATSQSSQYSWQVIGDPNVKLAKPSN